MPRAFLALRVAENYIRDSRKFVTRRVHICTATSPLDFLVLANKLINDVQVVILCYS